MIHKIRASTEFRRNKRKADTRVTKVGDHSTIYQSVKKSPPKQTCSISTGKRDTRLRDYMACEPGNRSLTITLQNIDGSRLLGLQKALLLGIEDWAIVNEAMVRIIGMLSMT